MLNIYQFLSHKKTILIAPAGYGKTHTIAAAMDILKIKGKHLILTHTHAGIGSIKEKLKKECIPSNKFHVETISGFAQRYVLSFYKGIDIPNLNDKNYFSFILEKAFYYFRLKPIQKILLRSYDSLFVDEYQDCTSTQHELILLISALFPTRFLGDPLQGIFQFNPLDPLVNMNDEIQMKDFISNKYTLEQPQRWLRGNNETLGENLKCIRSELLLGNPIDLSLYSAIESHCYNEEDLNIPTSLYYKKLSDSIKGDSLLIIHPNSTSIHPRISLIKKFNNRFLLLESIDDKDFYKLAGKFDNVFQGGYTLVLKEVCLAIFNKTELGKWFNEKGLISKTGENEKSLIKPLKTLLEEINLCPSFNKLRSALLEVSKLPMLKCYRKEIFSCLCKALQHADNEKTTVAQAMAEIRNSIRRYGKKTNVKCIGTTLLTKGLEFDTVIVLNAHQFNCPKHLYVAFTRACKKLIVFSNSNVLTTKSINIG
ncbi:UvrD-helicase domain-containing protein [Pedobacter cryoconitis]|uniref:DNA 3'-5' helicase II n=1 Tax=Pedobacter cryoconitis TaxID=188932 RepID=A0A7X0JA06_9SPHI|nr:UvrD-helicase domain-containing protein [Pedobacter cryoconitis]MBB6503002.1 DNA helicase-2/ATP-dependent DNA helicase PcrA [Pedobacter cryoconitis]